MLSAADEEHPSRLDLDKEQHQQSLQPERLDREAVTGEHACGVSAGEGRQNKPARRGIGGTPSRRSSARIVVAQTVCRSLSNSPRIR
jgi:hypothetical protein